MNKEIKKYIEEKYGYEVVNYGTDSTERFNYPVSGESLNFLMNMTPVVIKIS